MVRKLKHHEQKLLKKVNLVDWDHKSLKELKYMRKYHLTREEYTKCVATSASCNRRPPGGSSARLSSLTGNPALLPARTRRRYNKLIHQVREVVHQLKELDEDEFRIEASNQLTAKLHAIGLIQSKRLKTISRLSASAFAKRRLPVFIVKSGMFHGPLSTAGRSRPV